MDLTQSFEHCFPPDVLARYPFAETRNAATVLAATNPCAFEQIMVEGAE